MRRFQGFCWWVAKLLVLGAVLGVVVAVPQFYHRVDEAIRRRMEAWLCQQYHGVTIRIRCAQLREGEGIELRGLKFIVPGSDGPGAELLQIDEMFLGCRADLEELIRGEPEIHRVRIRRPVLRAVVQADGTWNVAKLLPWPQVDRGPPPVKVEDGVIEIVDPRRDPIAVLTLRDLNLTLTPGEPSPQQPAAGYQRTLRGTLSSDFLRQASFEGVVDPHRREAAVSGSVQGLEISPELRDALPEPLAAKLAELGSLRALGKVDFRLSYQATATPPLRFEVTGQIAQGSVDDPRLPHPLNDLRADFRITDEGLAVDRLLASCGPATVRVGSYRRAGFDRRSPQWLEAEVRELELDRRLWDILPGELQSHWYHYLPTGQIHANLKLAFDGRTWQPEVAVQCLNVSFSYHKFPYRLQQARGSVSLKDDVLLVSMMASSGSQPVRIVGRIEHPFAGPVGEMEAKGEALPVDDKLLSALPAKWRSAVQSLRPGGTIAHLNARLWRDRADQPWRRHVVAHLSGCSVRYEKFPYPLGNIQGTLEMLDDQWTFRDLRGTNDTGVVTCVGRLTPVPEGADLSLHFHGTNIALEDELRDALGQPNMQQVWNDLRLRGMVDLDADVAWRTGQRRAAVAFRAEWNSEQSSIEPVHFPYRLERLRGALVYRDGQASMEHFRAEHGGATLSSAVRCTFLPDGGWHVSLEGLSVDRLRVDRELIQALPHRVKRTLLELNPNGPLSLAGTFEVARGGQPTDPLTCRWDLDVGFCQTSVDCGVKLENLHGSVRLTGDFDGQRIQSGGELDMDSVSFRNIQFTRVRGPLWIDDQQVLFGTQVVPLGRPTSAQSTPSRPITATLFGGTLVANGGVALHHLPHYEVHATLSHADLSRCAQETLPGPQNLSGQILATVNLRGVGRSLNSLAGAGSIHLRNADIYELPLMIALLKILSIREPDRTAFSESDIRFRIEGPHLYFDQVNFTGDAISLEGKGEMDFQTAIKLRFRAQLGRNELRLPVIREVLGGASEQIMMIHVEGTLCDPVTRREPFPIVQKALQEFRYDLQQSTGSAGLLPHARRWTSEGARRLPRKQQGDVR